MSKHRLALVSILLALYPISVSYSQVMVASAVGRSLADDINRITARDGLENATIGIYVRSLKTGKVVYSKNADLSLVPASNQKILTAATAIRTLGLNFTFRTSVCSIAKPDASGTLRGDLYLRGSGDPSFSSAELDHLAKEIAAAGIKRFIGKIVGDGSAFDNQRLGTGWQWDDEPFYYSAQVSGLNCDENVVTVGVTPGGSVGELASVSINSVPAAEETFLSVENRVVTVAASTSNEPYIQFDRRRGVNRIVLTGTIPVGAKEVTDTVTVEDPASFTASRFVLALVKAGIAVDTPLWIDAAPTPVGTTELANVDSKSLTDLLKSFLKSSDNLYGEALLKAIGHVRKSADPGSTASGAEAINDFLRSAGIPVRGLQIADGSGLSVQNIVTPRQIGSLLAFIDQKFTRDDRTAFYDALPIGGVDGTIRNRFKKLPLVGNVRAKTGTLSGASSLSGYLTAKSGEKFVFSILINHAASAAKAREAQDIIVTTLYGK